MYPDKRHLQNLTAKITPKGESDPTPEEMAACRPFLESEMASRTVVVCLGKSAIRDLLGYEGKMDGYANTEQRRTVQGKEVVFIPTYHPMACIYNKKAREELLNTMLKVKGCL